MIEKRWRYWSPDGFITPRGPSTWHVLDWDQRRIIGVTMDEGQEEDDKARKFLDKHIDSLGPDVFRIHVSLDGELISVSPDARDDQMRCPHYAPLQEIQDHLDKPVRTILRSELRELDRMSCNVDLVSYRQAPGDMETRKTVAFKYYFLQQFIFRWWHEMNIYMRLPPHPNIAPFDRLVLDELHGKVVGFTTVYIPGGTVDENVSRVFKLEWFKQLTRVVDDLNLKYGIIHQDIAARNLLVDEATDNIVLFDFNFSGRLGGIGHVEDRNDVKGVIFTLYDIITRDEHFRKVPHEQQNPADVQGMTEWVKHPDVNLDHPVSAYRSVLDEWVKAREQQDGRICVYTEAPEHIDWPELEKNWRTMVFASGGSQTFVSWCEGRYEAIRDGKVMLNWERPPQRELADGRFVLANGKFEDDA